MKAKTNQKSGSKSRANKPRTKPDTARWQLPQPAKSNTGKILLATLSVGAAGVVGYFGWQYYKKKKEAKSENLDNELLKIHPNTPPVDTTHHTTVTDTTYTPPVDTTGTKSGKTKSTSSGTGDDFPLKKGSKGDNVRQLQQALINKYGSSILPKYGADGDFGSETQNALKKKGLPNIISESTFNVITQSGGSDKSSLSSLAQKLYNAASAKNFNSVISLLKNIANKDDYQQVSDAFMQLRLHGVRQTLVNGLLGSFTSEDQKQKIRMEFIRMGLQYDGNKWSLSGFDGKPIVTKEPATVWVNATESVQVPAMMVLGNEVTQRLDFTLFENNNKYFLVKTQSVKYL